jgi:hypothetical protein
LPMHGEQSTGPRSDADFLSTGSMNRDERRGDLDVIDR